MKQLYRFICVVGILGVASTLISGCGGGSSSSGSGTKANLFFSNTVATNADSRDVTVSGDSDGNDEGVHTGFSDNTNLFHIFVTDESGSNYRQFYFYTPYEGNITPDEGAVLNFASDPVSFGYYDEDINGDWTATSGTATVVSVDGPSIKLRLNNVVFEADGGGATGSFTINGTVSYNENNTYDETNFNIQSNGHKAASAAAQKANKIGTASASKSFKW